MNRPSNLSISVTRISYSVSRCFPKDIDVEFNPTVAMISCLKMGLLLLLVAQYQFCHQRRVGLKTYFLIAH